MGINRDVALPEEKGSDIIDSGGVVGMLMCEQDAVKTGDVISEHLLPEVRAAINDETVFFPGDENRYAKPFILGVGTSADGVVTPDYRDTL
jgi:hypothetical protein